MTLNDFNNELKETVKVSIETDSLDPFKKFYKKWQGHGIYSNSVELPADNVLEISIRKMAVHIASMPEEIKVKATVWLLERGYDLFI